MRIIIPLPIEALKAVDRKDKATIDMFGGGQAQGGGAPAPGGDASHGGRLHAEKRVDAKGHTQTRWIAPAEAPAPDKPPPLVADPATVTTEHGSIEGSAGNAWTPDGEEHFLLPRPGFVITGADVHEGHRGKGHGQALYLKAMATHGRAYSFWPVSEDAQRVHEALERKGLIVRRDITTPEAEFVELEPTEKGLAVAAMLHGREASKSGPIANAPGLHLDPVSHRWTRGTPSTAATSAAHSLLADAPESTVDELAQLAHEAGTLYDPTSYDAVPGHEVAAVLKHLEPKPHADDGSHITVYHATTPTVARAMLRRGVIPEAKPHNLGSGYSPGHGIDRGLYVGGTPQAVDSYGRVTLAVRVPKHHITVPTELAQLGETDPGRALHEHDGAVILNGIHHSAISLHSGNIEAHKDAPKLGFGEVGAGGERWITVHPHGDSGPGHPILIRQSAHDPTRARVIGGAGGKMTHMDLHLKSPDQWRAKAAERRKLMRDRRANMGADQRKSVDAALKTHREATSAQEAALHQKIAETMGWDTAPAEGDEAEDHHAELARRAKQAGDKARHVLIHSKEARTAAGVPVSEVLGTGAIRKTLGYSPDAADVADADMHAERVKVLQHRLATETDPHDQAVHARRLSAAKDISPDEITDASPAALAGFMRTVHGRIQTAIDSGDLDEETAAKLEIIAKRGKTAAAAMRATAEPGGDEAAREALKLAADVGLLDPKVHEEREKSLHEKRFSDAGAPQPDDLRATDLATMTPEAVKVLADEVAARSRAPGAKGGGGGGGGGGKQGGRDETDTKTVDLEELIDQHRAAGEVQEQGGGAPGLSTDDQKDLIARAIKAGIIGKDEGGGAAGAGTPPEGEAADEGKPARQMSMNMSPEQAAKVYQLMHQAKQARKQARKQAQAIARGEDPNVAAETAKEAAGKGGSFLAYDEDHAQKLVGALEEDIRVHTARNFLGQVESASEDVGKNLGMSHEEMQGHLQRHLSVGTTKAITEHAQHILGNAVIDRQAVDTLGSDGAAKLLAWAVHQQRGGDVDAIGDAVGDFHADTQQRVAEGAMAEAREAYHDAHDLHQAMEEEGEHGDMRLLASLNERRVTKLDDAIGKLGKALGEMQTTAALHTALKGKPPTEIRTSMGDMDPDQAVKQARAIGLHPDDYEVEHDGQSTFLRVKESGFGKLVRPVDAEGHRQEQDMEAIKRGDRDEPGWLPPDFSTRSAPPQGPINRVETHAKPMDYGLKEHESIEEAMDTFVAQRMHDGWTPGEVMSDLQSSDHHQSLEDAHQGGTMDLFGGGGGGDHDAEDLKARFNAHLDKLFPVRHDDTGTRRSAEHADATLKQIADAHPVDDGGLHGQTLDPKHSEDAAFRALARHPEASVAWKDPAALEDHERRALRAAFHRYHGNNEGEEMMRRWHDDHPEPPQEPDEAEGQQFGLFGEAPKQQPATAEEIKASREKLDMARERHKDLTGQVQDHEDALEYLGKERSKHPPEHPIHQEHAEMKARRDTLAEHAQTADQAVRAAEAEHRSLRDQGKSDAWKSWAKGRDEAREQASRKTPPSWETYVRAHGGTEGAYKAIQDQVKGRYMEDFRAHYQGLTQQPLRSGVASISGWQQHLHAMDPAFRDWAERSRKQAQGRLQARTAGRYAEDKVRARVEKNLENDRAAQQHQTSVGTGLKGADRDRLFHQGVPGAHERMALGDKAEAQIAQHVKDFAPMVDPSKPFDAFHGVHMDDRGPEDNKSLQQRAIKAFVRAKKLGLFLKRGSGKTNVALGAFSTLRDQGAARRGLFAAPTAVQGQFGGEALSFLKPGALRWFAKPGASREERMAAYADPGRHMVIVPHQTLRDDITSMISSHLNMPDAEVRERITGHDAEGNASDKGWKPEELDRHVKDAMHKHGADGLLDYMAVDEAHELLNREGKPDAHMTRVIDSLGRLSKHTGWMTGSPVKNDATEVYDWLHKIDPGKYHDGEGGSSLEEFKRRYGGDVPANKAALQRELARYSISGGVDPGTTPGYHQELLKPEPGQAQRLDEINDAYNKAKLAHMNGRTDVDSVRKLAPGLFEGKDEAEHEEIARGMHDPLRLAGLRTAATRRAIHIDPDGAKMKRTIELAKKYKREGRAGTIFAHDLAAIPLLKKHLEAAGINAIEYHGGMGGPERDAARTRFNKNGEGDVIIVSSAGQTGINMQRASYAIHHDMPDTYVKVDQRQGRVDRIGQKHKTPDIHSLLLDHPEEMAARDRVERKKALHHAVTDGAEHLDDSGLSSYIRQHMERKRAG